MIWKYDIKPVLGGNAGARLLSGTFELKMPEDAQIMEVATNRGEARLWAWVDPKNELVVRRFVLLGTGCDPQGVGLADYIDTYFVNERPYHLFEIGV